MTSIQVQNKSHHKRIQQIIDTFLLTMTNSLAKQDRTSCQSLTMISNRFPSNSASSFCGKIHNTPLNASVSLQVRSNITTNLHRPSSLILPTNQPIIKKKKSKTPIPHQTTTKHSQTISTFHYIPACESLTYKKARSATVSHQ